MSPADQLIELAGTLRNHFGATDLTLNEQVLVLIYKVNQSAHTCVQYKAMIDTYEPIVDHACKSSDDHLADKARAAMRIRYTTRGYQ